MEKQVPGVDKNDGCGAGISLLIGAALIIYVLFVAC
jgi:hypothetical protein